VLVLDDVDESRGSLEVRDEASELPSAVLLLRGICDGSESRRRRVEATFSLAGAKPNSEVVDSFSEWKRRLEVEVDEARGTVASGVAEL
jgi:hypothetical protein